MMPCAASLWLLLREPPSARRIFLFFFFNDTATTEIYTLSLHDALPIFQGTDRCIERSAADCRWRTRREDRKSTRLNSSHGYISYAVFCLKKKKRLTRFPNADTHPSLVRHAASAGHLSQAQTRVRQRQTV